MNLATYGRGLGFGLIRVIIDDTELRIDDSIRARRIVDDDRFRSVFIGVILWVWRRVLCVGGTRARGSSIA